MTNRVMELSDFVALAFQSPEAESFFYGYYNTPQLNQDGDKLLCQKASFEDRMPNGEDECEIGYFSIPEGRWHPLSKSKAFNWQQGSNLQWIGPDFNSRFIFNDREGEKFVARIFSLVTYEIKTLSFPSYAITPDGKFSLGIDYRRAFWTRAYSYAGIEDPAFKESINKEDGLFRMNLETDEVHQCFSLQDWLEAKGESIIAENKYWIEHPTLSLGGDYVFVYHRYGDANNFKTEGVILNSASGEVLHEVKLKGLENFTHIGWSKDDHIAMYITPQKSISMHLMEPESSGMAFRISLAIYRKVVKPFMPRKLMQQVTAINSFYRYYDFQNGDHEDLKYPEFTIDGHPSFTKDGAYMLTDTYQDGESYRHLYLLRRADGKVFHLGKFYSHVNNMGWRADLHPRFSMDDQQIIIDCNLSGYHQQIMLDLDWQKIAVN